MNALPIILPEPVNTIGELIDQYLVWVGSYYRDGDGKPSRRRNNLSPLLARIKATLGTLDPADFKPAHLYAFCETLAERGNLSRRYINDHAAAVKSMFRWAAERGYCAVECYDAAKVVSGIRRNRTAARESEGIKPVSQATLEATLKHIYSPRDENRSNTPPEAAPLSLTIRGAV